TTTTVTSSLNPSAYGTSPTFTAMIAPASGSTVPAGTVQFKIDTASVGSPVSVSACSPGSDACATFTPTAAQLPVAGSPHSITAVYSCDATFTQSTSAALLQTVNPKALTVTGITVADHVYDGGTTATLSFTSATLQGVVSGDVVTLSTTGYTANFASKTVAT